MHINQKKKFVAILSVVSNTILTLLKLFAGSVSGSLSIISEAVHSLSDLFASLITYLSVLKSSKPADNDHPYGHGKYEDMAGFVEGLLIIFAAGFIVYEAAEKIIAGHTTSTENHIGMIVMLIAVTANIFVSSVLFKTAKESGSISLYADAEHLRTDVYSSLGVFLGLVLIKITGNYVLDPLIAVLVAVFIYRTGYKISQRAFMNLSDHSLPDEDIEKISNMVNGISELVRLKENGIKARRAGPSKDIDLTLQFPGDITLCECHKICDEVEKRISEVYPNSSINIHSEPVCYDKDCQNLCNKNTCRY